MANKSFILYDSFLDDLDEMSPEECKFLLLSIRSYRRGENIAPSDDRFMRSKINSVIEQISKNEDAYIKRCEQFEINKKKYFESKRIEKADSENSITYTPPTKPSPRFIPPTIDDVLIYFSEKGYPSQEGHKFYNYYDSNGWKVGKNSMKKWHSAAALWMSKRETPQSNGYSNTKYQRQVEAEQQLGQALAQRSAEELQRELDSSDKAEGRFVPPAI